MKFKVGDRVIGNKAATNSYAITVEGWEGKVTKVYENSFSATGKGSHGKEGFSLSYDCFDLVDANQTVVIYCHDSEVIATLKSGKQTVKTAKAKRNPSDEFKFEIGANLAFQRLIGEEVKVSKPEAVPFDWEGFKSGKFAVHCDTEEKAREFLKECDGNGIRWGFDLGSTTDDFKWAGNSYCYKFFNEDGGVLQTPINSEYTRDIKIIDYIPSKPTVKDVHRPAVNRENIKIINTATGTIANYVGRVFQINKATDDGYGEVTLDGDGVPVAPWDYNVLENYQPEDKPEATKPDISILDNFTLEEIARYIIERFGDK